jgi:tRNA(fMet)-specific endonuclease VapC
VGILIDSTVVIGAERAGKNPRHIVEDLQAALGDTDATLSVVTIAELAHGIERADSTARRTARERFLNELLKEFPVEPISVSVAFRAGKIDGSLQARHSNRPRRSAGWRDGP